MRCELLLEGPDSASVDGVCSTSCRKEKGTKKKGGYGDPEVDALLAQYPLSLVAKTASSYKTYIVSYVVSVCNQQQLWQAGVCWLSHA